MAANVTDKLKKLSKRWVGQIGSGAVADGTVTTIPLASTTNLATDTAVIATIDRVDANGVATPNLEESVIGVVSGSNLVNCVRATEGTAQAHNAGAVVEILVTAKGYNDIVDWGLVEHNQDGTHKAGTLSAYSTHSMARQAIINGNFDIWQRNTTKANPADGEFVADRFAISVVNNGTLPTTITHSRQLQTSGDLFNSNYFYRIAPNGAGSGFGNSDYYQIFHKIEHGTRYLAGASEKVTLSFWARSSISNKKIGYSLGQSYGTGGSPSSEETITGSTTTLTSSWQKITYTFTTNTLASKTFGTNLNDYLIFHLFEMWGSTIGTDNGLGAAETFVGSGNIDIAQIQLCAGEVALPFQPKSFNQELLDCMRYYQKSFPYSTAPAQSASANGGLTFTQQVGASTLQAIAGGIKFSPRMRTAPTITTYAPNSASPNIFNENTATAWTGTTTDYIGESSARIYGTSPGGSSAGQSCVVHWAADAEL